MRIRDILRRARDIPVAEAIYIAAHTLSVRKEDVLTGSDAELDPEIAGRVEAFLEQRRYGKPLAYITGEKEFFSLSFCVDGRVLIPRPETEFLVEEAISLLRKRPERTAIMDLGTGSGAIGLTVARYTGRRVLCVDNSPAALAVAKENTRRLGVEGRTFFLCTDLFGGLRDGLRFDLILANLPYVSESAWEHLDRDVREYEPAGALKGGIDGLEVYRRFAGQLTSRMAPRGVAICEIDGPEQAKSLESLLGSQGFTVATKNDYSGRERVVVAYG